MQLFPCRYHAAAEYQAIVRAVRNGLILPCECGVMMAAGRDHTCPGPRTDPVSVRAARP